MRSRLHRCESTFATRRLCPGSQEVEQLASGRLFHLPEWSAFSLGLCILYWANPHSPTARKLLAQAGKPSIGLTKIGIVRQQLSTSSSIFHFDALFKCPMYLGSRP